MLSGRCRDYPSRAPPIKSQQQQQQASMSDLTDLEPSPVRDPVTPTRKKAPRPPLAAPAKPAPKVGTRRRRPPCAVCVGRMARGEAKAY
ncbi:hypothetical protein GQ602_004714 [Ophiocordyceps camponoti-floridani]|uniref:Uncharacterized protein n=1 Tax=Ophiocordyceps camponoti-floridani TaxID=2030778 RepID=A0A8H4Q4G4_9HYPO|nr:hypothetical protein GQ602_004714 [Ophiocordyceps camponoti-floridani]